MQLNRSIFIRSVAIIALLATLTILSNRIQADTGTCGGVTITLPFNDVMASPFFCQIAAAYYSGLANGTTATTYSPTDTVTREQMAVFTTRTLDQSLKRGSQRAALNQWWTIKSANNLGLTTVGSNPQLVQSDGKDLWVACGQFNPECVVSRVRASDGKLLETWTGANGATGVLVAMGRIFITGSGTGSSLYMIDPRKPAGNVTTVVSNLPDFVMGIAFDGERIWLTLPGQVAIVNPETWNVTFVNSRVFSEPRGIIFDGTNIWVADIRTDTILKLDSAGNILQSVAVGDFPIYPIFDGTNIWVPNFGSNTVTVVRASTGAVLATLTGNGLSGPHQAAFDGERIMVTNLSGGNVCLWKASDFTPLGFFSTGANGAFGVCSDGINFWITLKGQNKLARF